MIKAIELAKFAEKHGWIVIDKEEAKEDNFIRYLTPSGNKVIVEFNEEGGIERVYP